MKKSFICEPWSADFDRWWLEADMSGTACACSELKDAVRSVYRRGIADGRRQSLKAWDKLQRDNDVCQPCPIGLRFKKAIEEEEGVRDGQTKEVV